MEHVALERRRDNVFFLEEDYSFEMWLTEIRQASKL